MSACCRPSLQRVLDAFEAMSLGPSGPGQAADVTADPAYYPRPTGEEAAMAGAPPPPFLPGNCDPRYMRLTVNAVPAQQVGGWWSQRLMCVIKQLEPCACPAHQSLGLLANGLRSSRAPISVARCVISRIEQPD